MMYSEFDDLLTRCFPKEHKADPTVQYVIRNDAPRGGAAGEHYLFTGDRAWANRFMARLSAKLAPSV